MTTDLELSLLGQAPHKPENDSHTKESLVLKQPHRGTASPVRPALLPGPRQSRR